MPVEFLTEEQVNAQGRLANEPTRPEQERVTFPGEGDRTLIAKRRVDNKCLLGHALQLCMVRCISRFLEDPFGSALAGR